LPERDGREPSALTIVVRHSNLSVSRSLEHRCLVVDAQAASAIRTPNDCQLAENAVSSVQRAIGVSPIRFRASGVADFLIEEDGQWVTVVPRATCTGPVLNHWLLDQLLPRVLAHQGRTVLHAAAVRATPERAIALLGETGAGKSTLTAGLHQAGYRLLSDDALVLKTGQGGVTALPTYPSLRLWPDAIAELYDDVPPVAPMRPDSTKQRLLINAPEVSTGQPVPLAALYLLEGASDPAGNGISLTQLSGREACMAIISNAFQLDPSDTQRAARLMTAAADVARRVPVFSLSYPRDFARLPDVCAAVIEHSRGLARVTHETAESG
jgi:hypothetical protein